MNGIDWKGIPLFADLPDEWIDEIKDSFRQHCVAADQNLITEGEWGDEMYILVSGRVRITKSMIVKDMVLPLMESTNPEKVLATLDGAAHPIFGEIALIDRDTRSATVSVIEDSEFLALDRESFYTLIERRPDIGCHLLLALAKRMASNIRHSNGELVKLSTALALALSRYVK